MRLRSLIGAIFVGLAAATASNKTIPSQPSIPASSAETEKAARLRDHGYPNMLCPEDINKACYPEVFVPTNEFQVVLEGQSIPPGLHVRLNMQTGETEAKLYDPSQDTDVPNAVEVLPDQPLVDETAQMVQTGGQVSEDEIQKQVDEFRKAKAKLGSEVKPPHDAGHDRGTFLSHIETLKQGADTYDETELSKRQIAFRELEDLCHDIYWGQELLKDRELLDMLAGPGRWKLRSNGFKSEMVGLLGTALQNNAAALDRLEAYAQEQNIEWMKWVLEGLEDEIRGPSAASRYIYHLSALLSRDEFSRQFLQLDGGQVTAGALGEMQESLLSDPEGVESMIERREPGYVGEATVAALRQRLQAVKVDMPRFERKVKNLLDDHYFSEEGKKRTNEWAAELEARVEEGTDAFFARAAATSLCNSLRSSWQLRDCVDRNCVIRNRKIVKPTPNSALPELCHTAPRPKDEL